MGRREKPLDPGAGAVQRFAYELRGLRDGAGTPTCRAMAAPTGYSGPTLSAPATVPTGDGPALAVGFGADDRQLRIASAHLTERSRPLDPRRAAAEVCARAHGGAGPATWRRYLHSVPYRRTCDGT
ncbi:hypothetical protein [Streptomyces sp. NPDC048191]|uniref:hypothetical protein n=1 Tax=Streptomyces sp. NPDC048191 TaxID=3155484 RepID=UPI0033C1B22B